jgi:hypothetical protein
MKLSAFICTTVVCGFLACPAWAAPTNAIAISVKPILKTKSTKIQKRIKHPVLLRVKRTRTQAQSKDPLNAKQFDLSGALRSAK